MLRLTLAFVVLAATAAPAAADWNPALAVRYLDARQQAWFDWKTAQSSDGPCVSCHTGMTYLLARPVLRRALHETGPTVFETGYLTRLRTMMSLFMQDAATAFAAMVLVDADAAFRR